MTSIETHASDREQLLFLAGECRKALAIVAQLPLDEYFRRHGEGDRLALALERSTDHIATALNVLQLGSWPHLVPPSAIEPPPNRRP